MKTVKAPTLDRRHQKAQQGMPQKPQALSQLEKNLHLPTKPVVKPSQIGRLDKGLTNY